MQNLLILTPYVPYPLNSGGNKITFELLDRLRKYINISIAFYISEEEVEHAKTLSHIWPDVHIHIHRKERKDKTKDIKIKSRRYFNLLDKINRSTSRKMNRLILKSADADEFIRLNSGLYSDQYKLLTDEYITFANKVIDSKDFDIIQVEFIDFINVVNTLPKEAKKIFVHHEIKYVTEEQKLSLLAKPTPVDRYRFNYFKNYELSQLNAYDAIITLTDVDNKKMKKDLRCDLPIYTSPAIVNIEDVKFEKSFNFNNMLVFLGGSDHFPNLQGIDWFLKNCWGHIQQLNPRIKLNIIGSWRKSHKDLYSSQFDNVEFTGFVDDLNEKLKNSIMIVPILIGSGLRIKILEGINRGCPLVTTTIGVEGNNLVENKDCLIADDPIKFADDILRLANDNNLCNELRNNAKNAFGLRPSPDQLTKVRLDIYQDVLDVKFDFDEK